MRKTFKSIYIRPRACGEDIAAGLIQLASNVASVPGASLDTIRTNRVPSTGKIRVEVILDVPEGPEPDCGKPKGGR